MLLLKVPSYGALDTIPPPAVKLQKPENDWQPIPTSVTVETIRSRMPQLSGARIKR